MLEGMDFFPNARCENVLIKWILGYRDVCNEALRKGDTATACRELDVLVAISERSRHGGMQIIHLEMQTKTTGLVHTFEMFQIRESDHIKRLNMVWQTPTMPY